jgi:hypothetical protein
MFSKYPLTMIILECLTRYKSFEILSIFITWTEKETMKIGGLHNDGSWESE